MIGVILAGGKSLRFKSNKAFHEIDGKPFYVYVYDAMRHADIEKIVISTNQQTESIFLNDIKKRKIQCEVISDDLFQDCGPLGGIYEVMSHVEADAYTVVSTDTPFIKDEAITHLMNIFNEEVCDAAIYHDEEQSHYTIAIYSHLLKDDIYHALTTGNYRMKVLSEGKPVFVNVNQVKGTTWYENINTHEKLEEVLKERGKAHGNDKR